MAAERAAYVLDSFALLAYLQGEAGGPIVTGLLDGAQSGAHVIYLSLINLGELLYIIERERGLLAAQRVLAVIDQLPITTLPVTRAAVLAAAHLKAIYTIAYADAFAVAAANEHAATLVTGDREFEAVTKAGVVKVQWLPR